MKKIEPEAIKTLLDKFLNDNTMLSTGVAEARAEAAWAKVVGESTAALTQKIYIRNGTLHVFVSSAVVRSEIIMNRKRIAAAINREVGMNIVKSMMVK